MARAATIAICLGLAATNCVTGSTSSGRSKTLASADDDAVDLVVGGATLHIDIEAKRALPRDAYVEWVRHSAEVVSAYFGKFPVPTLHVDVMTDGGGGLGWGKHWGGKLLRVRAGSGTSPEDLEEDWVMIHEMLHTAFPELMRKHRWMQEGLSTYLEPIVRARFGDLSETEVWAEWVGAMHHGLPQAGDRGLDNTHTWGRTYWGGALYWLMVDLEIRKRSGNTRSIRDALLEILAQGGNARVDWSIDRVIALGDAGSGTLAVSELYQQMALGPMQVDLEHLWQELGITRAPDGRIVFDDSAPLAAVRKAITAPDA